MDNKVPQQINDIVGDNVKKLAQLFPSAVKDGEVDFEALKEELGQYEEVGSEKYELTWAGKKNAKRIAQEDVIGRTLKFIPEDSKEADTTENLYIEGDNLEVLKLLRQNYYGAIKMIYIDPPYNTGNDFIYNDSFEMEQEESDIAEGVRNEVGERYIVNTKSDNRYHANWMNMIYPRLMIAKDLLTDDGAIFISIDDNEIDNVLKICNEIFGEINYVAIFPWRKRTAKSDVPYGISQDFEWILCYAKTTNFKCSIDGKERKYFTTEDFPEKPWRIHDLTKQTTASERPNSFFTIKNPKNGSEYPANPNRTWAITQETFEQYYQDNRIVFPGDYSFLNISKPALRYWKEDDMRKAGDNFGKIAVSTKLPDDIGMSQDGTKEITNLFSGKIFPFPKPTSLVKFLCKICTGKDDIILDFFSGSSTTAQSVMELNYEDNANRKFIMIQLSELLDKSSEAHKLGYINLCQLGKERIRRAGDKIKSEHPEADIDIGFKVFRTADTNIKWNSLMDMGQVDMNQLEYTPDLVDFMPDANDVDVVYELMLRQRDVALSETLEQLSDIGSRTYLYASSYLVCMETQITEEMVGKLAELDPLPIKFIFRDSAFKDDIALKDETFRRLKALIEKNAGTNKPTYTVEFI
ncbi:site-specific DNA-methyltransferase [Agathobacter rectalis]|jgi:adenine-specific DNA-methyltransferase|uniref:Site-specific DNA-methyltransferase n=1 Tax=Agathobacter rectalis TaxID=39491 RepID=A0A395V1U5_9FIRM|nr:site-specific DNA-methyltransferase [Agathobacter rectalis]RGR57112.1 site-specific DNA-methyltransferase [Agathobacter rectalis]